MQRAYVSFFCFSTDVENFVEKRGRNFGIFSFQCGQIVENKRIYSEYSQFQPSFQHFFRRIPLFSRLQNCYKSLSTSPHFFQSGRWKSPPENDGTDSACIRGIRFPVSPLCTFQPALLLLLIITYYVKMKVRCLHSLSGMWIVETVSDPKKGNAVYEIYLSEIGPL